MMKKRTGMIVLIGMAVAGSFIVGTACRRKDNAPEDRSQDYRKMLDDAREKTKRKRQFMQLESAVQVFQTDLGRLPTNLQEVVTLGYAEEIPGLPAHLMYQYDPVRGHVTIREIPQEYLQRRRLQAAEAQEASPSQ